MDHNLKKIRLAKKMTQREMADLLGYTVEHYNKVENGTCKKNFPLHRAAILVNKFNIALDDIFLT
jgi:transcriptional regulator with XRE-family HTH domain